MKQMLMLIKLITTYCLLINLIKANEDDIQFLEELEGKYNYSHDKINLALKYTKTKNEAIELIERMYYDDALYNKLLEASKEKGDLMNKYNHINLHYEMIIIVRKDLKMSVGKIAAQVGHAVLLAYKQALKQRQEIVLQWELNGQAKLILAIDSFPELNEMKSKADTLNIPSAFVADAGYTEVLPDTITCLGIGPGPVDEIEKIRGGLPLL